MSPTETVTRPGPGGPNSLACVRGADPGTRTREWASDSPGGLVKVACAAPRGWCRWAWDGAQEPEFRRPSQKETPVGHSHTREPRCHSGPPTTVRISDTCGRQALQGQGEKRDPVDPSRGSRGQPLPCLPPRCFLGSKIRCWCPRPVHQEDPPGNPTTRRHPASPPKTQNWCLPDRLRNLYFQQTPPQILWIVEF